MVKVKILNDDSREPGYEHRDVSTKDHCVSENQTKVLTDNYIRKFNQGVSYRIAQREHSGTEQMIVDD